MKLRLGAGAHHAAALCRPVGETVEIIAVFPGELEEFPGVEMGGFFPQEGLKAPLEIGTVPGLQPISASSYPVVAERLPHAEIVHGRMLRAHEIMVNRKKKPSGRLVGGEMMREQGIVLSAALRL